MYDYNYCDFDDPIANSNDPNLVDTVSELRHYTNIYGINQKIIDHFKTSRKTLSKIIDGCFGSLFVEDLISDSDYLTDQINERRQVQNDKKRRELLLVDRIETLKTKRKTFCDIGTNKIKRRLNILSKTNNLAKAYRLALEIEDKNIQAKQNWYYSDAIYNKKNELISELILLFKDEKYTYGKQNSEVKATKHIIYFEIPNCEQISFHCDLDKSLEVPTYEKEWDKKENSTLIKIETGILKSFVNINKEK